jgi:outer membrane receptor protein involved in Fe transport
MRALGPAFLMMAALAHSAPAAAQQADAAATAPAAAPSPADWDGLVEVNARRFDTAFLLPGADFRPYTKVLIDEPEVAFRQNWLRDVNRSRSPGRRVTEADAERILQSVSASTIDIFARAFTDAGYEVVTRRGPDVLEVRTGIVNLFVNAPDTMSAGRSQTFTANAGEATLVLEARDGPTRALLARIVDRRETRGLPGATNSVTNTSEFRSLANSWARIAASRLAALKEVSPVPDPLTPGQRLQ